MSGPVALSVVLPCRNQASYIERVIEGFADALSDIDYELVIVPNASLDGTAERAAACAAANPRIRVIAIEEPGWGRAVRTGLRASRGQTLGYTNSARTNPATLEALYRRHARAPEGLSKVSRVSRRAPLRSLGSWVYNLEVRLLFGLRVRDVNGTPKLLSRTLYERVALTRDDDLLDLELLAQVHCLGVPVVEMTVPGFSRHGGRSSTGLASAWGMYAGAVAIWADSRRRRSRA
jgi:glycosyltransferase involved in cell wall biosynthesis